MNGTRSWTWLSSLNPVYLKFGTRCRTLHSSHHRIIIIILLYNLISISSDGYHLYLIIKYAYYHEESFAIIKIRADCFMSRGTNDVSKRIFIKQFAFPVSTDDRLIVKASSSGIGFDSSFKMESESIIEYRLFEEEVRKVWMSDK